MKDSKLLLVSDYDGTYKVANNIDLFFQNNQIIKELIDNNVLFMLSTGRMYYSIMDEINKYNIKYDFISCGNGVATLDNNGKIINYNTIDYEAVKFLEKYYKYLNSYAFLNLYGDENNKENVELLIKINTEYLSLKREIIKILISQGLDYYTDGDDMSKLHIFKKIGKVKSIKIVQKEKNILDKDVICIGDSLNDLDMIKEYNGYIISGGKISKKYNNLQEYKYLRDLLLDIKENRLIKKRNFVV